MKLLALLAGLAVGYAVGRLRGMGTAQLARPFSYRYPDNWVRTTDTTSATFPNVTVTYTH